MDRALEAGDVAILNAGLLGNNRELYQRGSRKNNRFSKVFQHFFVHLSLSLHDYNAKMPNFRFYGGLKHITTNFCCSFSTCVRSLRIQFQENSPKFGILSEPEQS